MNLLSMLPVILEQLNSFGQAPQNDPRNINVTVAVSTSPGGSGGQPPLMTGNMTTVNAQSDNRSIDVQVTSAVHDTERKYWDQRFNTAAPGSLCCAINFVGGLHCLHKHSAESTTRGRIGITL
jgi:hypothetical protein